SVETTREYDSSALADGKIDASDTPVATGTASSAGWMVNPTPSSETLFSVAISGSAANPLVLGGFGPAIDWCYTITVDSSADPAMASMTGGHDDFPAYEVYIDGRDILMAPP